MMHGCFWPLHRGLEQHRAKGFLSGDMDDTFRLENSLATSTLKTITQNVLLSWLAVGVPLLVAVVLPTELRIDVA